MKNRAALPNHIWHVLLASKLQLLCHYFLSRFANIYLEHYLLELPDTIGDTAIGEEKSSHFACPASSDQIRLALFTLLNFPCAFCHTHVF